MKKYLLSLSIALAFAGIANAQYQGTVDGLEQKSELVFAGNITAENYVRHHAATFDASGNAFVSLAFDSQLNGIEPIGVSAMVIKLNETGAEAWSAPIIGAATVKDLLSDGNGGVYAAGVFADEVEFRGTDGATIVKDGYQEEGAYTTMQAASFIAHYDAEGKLLNIGTIVPTHDPNLDATGMYFAEDGDTYCSVQQLAIANGKVYALYTLKGAVETANGSFTSGSMDAWGIGWYAALQSAFVAEIGEDMSASNIVASIGSETFTTQIDSYQLQSMRMAADSDNLYLAFIATGPNTLTTAGGEKKFEFSWPTEGGIIFGYGLARINLATGAIDATKQSEVVTSDEYYATEIKQMYKSGNSLVVCGNFQKYNGFYSTAVATGSSDVFMAFIDPTTLDTQRLGSSRYDEGDATQNEEIFTSSAICGGKLFVSGYAASKTDHSLITPINIIADLEGDGEAIHSSNSGYIFGTAANEAGNMLLTAWSHDLTGSCFTRYGVTSGGVNDAIGKLNVNVYPNPVADVLRFSEAADVELTSLSGAKVAAAKGVTSLDVTGLASGVYVAKVTTAAGTTAVKIVKSK